ncbi:hypothetical protein CPLU01_16092 [Colletotrichum plurivorum]|uniref:Uncharacterized protein n=1 Tax=Colletotrichum plurivorum TaxID=2175906 RepID=A0A8H6MPW7_9PEZI|nr:hypothetical protein CPLU01_16092 [Colletotrichum plurivorum]
MSPYQSYQINIAVTLGSQELHHTGLWLIPVGSGGGGGGPTYYCHVRGSLGSFAYESIKDFDPTRAKASAKIISIGDTARPVAVEKLLGIMGSVSVHNQDPGFSSEAWVDTAAAKMHESGYLTRNQYEALIDAVTVEA